MPRRQADLSRFPCACTALRKASRAVARHYESCLASSGITATQFSILRCLEREGPLPLSRAAEQLVMERTSLYRAIAPLVRDRLVSITDDPHDARARLVALTRRGAARIRRILPHWEQAQGSFLESVGAREWRQIASGLQRLLENVPETTR